MLKQEVITTFIQSEYPEIQSQLLDSSKANIELNWSPLNSFEENLQETIFWYLDILS